MRSIVEIQNYDFNEGVVQEKRDGELHYLYVRVEHKGREYLASSNGEPAYLILNVHEDARVAHCIPINLPSVKKAVKKLRHIHMMTISSDYRRQDSLEDLIRNPP